jgi:RNA polymerase sigma-70 factor (ECF subfamily)
MDSEDQKLVNAFIGSHSEKSFRDLYKAKTPRLYMLAMRLTGQNIPLSEELIQETWVRAIQKLPSFQWKSSLLTWLTGILINLNRERFRELVHYKLTEEISDRTPSANKIEIMDLENAIKSLPHGYRQILILHDVEGYKHREIAEMLEIEEGTSKSQLFQARRAIRKFLNDKDYGRN